MKLPVRIDDNPGYDWGWVFLDAEGKEVSPDEMVHELNRLAALQGDDAAVGKE